MVWGNDDEDSCGGYQCSRKRNQCKPSEFSDNDKENIEMFGADNDLCLYDTLIPPSSDLIDCNFLPDHDPNSLDSGYAATNSDSPKTSSFDSFEDSILDITELNNDDENAQMHDFNKLLCDPIKSHEVNSHTTIAGVGLFKRSLSMLPNTSVPTTSRARSCLFKVDINYKSCKRAIISPENQSPKRLKVLGNVENIIQAKNKFSRSISACEDTIKTAFERESERDLIGDFSKEFCLPLISGRHQDLKSITPTTLAMLLRGHFNNTVASFKVIDCRYPYEYEGGHIIGATNLYTKQQVMNELLNSKATDSMSHKKIQSSKRHILVFHCEFSSERGPNLSRFLRNLDRVQNENVYPHLHYPEIYLLDGGYKCFYEQYSELCAPDGYLPMLHPGHETDLRYFRAKSKTFNCDFRLNTH